MQKVLVQEQIAREIRRRIVAGIYAPGQLMPKESDLALEFHTSRRTIGSVLGDLAGSGIVARRPGYGTHVIDVSDRPARSSVAILLPEGAHYGPEGLSMVRGMQQKLSKLNQRCELVCDVLKRPDMTADEISRRYAGVLFVEALGLEELALELERRHFASIAANIEKDIAVSGSWIDHARSTQTAVELLAALGHRRIALLTRPPTMFFYNNALKGYRNGLANAGIAFDENMVIVMVQEDCPDSVGAYTRMREFLAGHPAPTALVACRDYLARGAYEALTEAGHEVGRDVSLIGFDDFSWPQANPFLTTFREPAEELGAVAAEMLVSRLISGWRPVERREVEAPLVVRKTVGPCPATSKVESASQARNPADDGSPGGLLLYRRHQHSNPVAMHVPV